MCWVVCTYSVYNKIHRSIFVLEVTTTAISNTQAQRIFVSCDEDGDRKLTLEELRNAINCNPDPDWYK